MDIKGDYTFDAPQHLVWEALRDPDVLGSVMPGGEGFEEVGENSYSGQLKVKVGPVQGKFKGAIQLQDIVEPTSYTIIVDGKGAPGFVKATGEIQLTGQGGQTLLDYVGNAQVGGRIASVGQRLMDASAKSIIRQSLDGLNEYLKVQVAREGAAAVGEDPAEVVVPEYKAPSQAAIAANVARDVASDLVPPNRLPLIIGGVAVLLMVILLVVFFT